MVCLIYAAVVLNVFLTLVASLEPSHRILFGNFTSIFRVPYQVSVQFDGRHACGGSIISSIHILSAAHCFLNAYEVTIRAGSSFQNIGGQLLGVESIIVHELYDDYTLKNDIAIVVLRKPLVFSMTIQPIQLATKKPGKRGGPSRGIVCGWGISETGQVPWNLRSLEVKIISGQDCQPYFLFLALPHSVICDARFDGPTVTPGDSGSGLVFEGKLLGITSWKNRAHFPNDPTVYTSVPDYLDWINAKTAPGLKSMANSP